MRMTFAGTNNFDGGPRETDTTTNGETDKDSVKVQRERGVFYYSEAGRTSTLRVQRACSSYAFRGV